MSSLSNISDYLKKEAGDIRDSVHGVVSDARASWKQQSANTFGKKLNNPPDIDPSKFKKIILTILKVLIGIELLSAALEGLQTGNWMRLSLDLLIAGALFILWERITRITLEQKEKFRRRVEAPGGRITLWDGLLFSLLWSDEIYTNIPSDRKRLVVISYTLIALGVAATAFLNISVMIVGALILAAVNLLSWVVSRERGERDTLATELALAHDVQVSLMPKSHPQVEGFSIAGVSFPAREVGGDHFDYLQWPDADGSLCISVFDVSGKGMHAAMSAVFASGALASEAHHAGSPADLLTRLNKAIYPRTKRGHFVAFLLARLNPRSKEIVFANAGQTKPLLKSGDSVRWLDSTGIHFPLGMMERCEYQQSSQTLQSGDVLCLLTDGVTEAMNEAREQYGSDRLAGLLAGMNTSTLSAEQIIQCAVADVRTFVGTAPQHDDMTIVVVKVL